MREHLNYEFQTTGDNHLCPRNAKEQHKATARKTQKRRITDDSPYPYSCPHQKKHEGEENCNKAP